MYQPVSTVAAGRQTARPYQSMIQPQSPAVAKAAAWLDANPGHGLSLRKAAAAAGVSLATMQRAMGKLQ